MHHKSLDSFSIGTSALCAVHCLFTPILLVLFPALNVLPFDSHDFHVALVWLITPMSLVAAFLGCKKHKNKSVMALIIGGLATLIVAALFGHDLAGETGEKVLTVVATLIIAVGHIRNYHLCRTDRCSH